MNKFFLILFLSSCGFLFCEDHCITYEFSGGRFGDNLLSYLHAKWLSYHYGVPLLYKPFNLSSDLALHHLETRLMPSHYGMRYRTGVENIAQDVCSSIPFFFTCPYFPEDPVERDEEGYFFFDVDWKDPGFRKLSFEMIQPKKMLRLVVPPEETVNIAVHVRDGENYDGDDFRLRFPLKLPSIQFYLEALPQVLERFRGKPIYCYVFTDAEHPQRIAKTLEGSVPSGISVRFDYRKGLNRHNWGVLDDFFSLFQFDVLLRSQSNFSMIASLLHDYAILCFPSDYRICEGKPVIETIQIKVQEDLYQKILREK